MNQYNGNLPKIDLSIPFSEYSLIFDRKLASTLTVLKCKMSRSARTTNIVDSA